MIELEIPCHCKHSTGPFVCRVKEPGVSVADHKTLRFECVENGQAVGRVGNVEVRIPQDCAQGLEGDILLVVPGQNSASRLIRSRSAHNTLLFTEQCDQLCVMCSQPPKQIKDRWRIPLYEEAIELADYGIRLGISGGEPTLQKELFFAFLERVTKKRPDISLHILTNGQHFKDEDVLRLSKIHNSADITWGVPLYSSVPNTHDRIVFKNGAFDALLPNLYRVGESAGKIELRTVLTAMNYTELPDLANFVSTNLFFIRYWSVMGLEPVGFAKAFPNQLFVDHSTFFKPLGDALDIAMYRGMQVRLFNIPLCTVPARYRGTCVDSISDWKKKFLPACETCQRKDECSGFFEWYNERWAYSQVHPLAKEHQP